jgi:2-aminoethylphosphonate-pyruvate transaminase
MNARRRTLFTPGPLTMSRRVAAAMTEDWGSRDPAFIALTASLLDGLKRLVEADEGYALVPIQGSGTYAVEAAIGSVVPRDGRLLVVDNGHYADRIVRIAEAIGRPCRVLKLPDDAPLDAAPVERALAADPSITHVAAVHLETVSGLVNPIEAIARAVAGAGRKLLVDAMSTFGAFDLRTSRIPYEALIFSSNKCLQGPPGVAFVLARESALVAGNSHSVALDLQAQWEYYGRTGQWRFTPPTHVVAATREALAELDEEGGPAARLARYADNAAALLAGCRGLGLATLLDERHLGPTIVAFRNPKDPRFSFDDLYAWLAREDLYIYPGNLSGAPCFRIGCIGDLHRADMLRLVEAMAGYFRQAGIGARAA